MDAGWYQPLRDALHRSLPPGSALDVGCGEGCFTQTLVQDDRPWVGAVDLSLHAVRAAASRYVGIDFAVADAYALPVEDCSVDVVLSIFGPAVSAEIDRVLRPGGTIVAAGPGPRHLLEIRRLLFDHPIEHPMRGPLGLEERFDRSDTLRVTFTMSPSTADFADLVDMTPYAYQVGSHQMKLELGAHLPVTADFLIVSYRHK